MAAAHHAPRVAEDLAGAVEVEAVGADGVVEATALAAVAGVVEAAALVAGAASKSQACTLQ